MTKAKTVKKIEKLEAGSASDVKSILGQLESVQSNSEGTIRYGRKGQFVIVIIDPKERYLSSTGKCYIRATTHGIQSLGFDDDGNSLGLSATVLQSKGKKD